MKKILIAILLSSSLVFATENNKIVKIGQETSLKLMKALKFHLIKAMSESPYEAIDVCHKKALKITKQIEKEINHGIKIKRTSIKYRNPLNKPNKEELEALEYFEKSFKEGKNPKYYIQKVKDGYNFYKPLKIKAICLTCHGNPKNMDKKLYEKIKKYYPEDKAINYKLGDFRGVIKVYIPQELVK